MKLKKYLLILVTSLTLALSLVCIPTTSAKRSGLKPKAKANKTSNRSAKTKPAPVAARVPALNNLTPQNQQLVPYSAQAVDFAVSPPLSEMGIDTKEVESMRRSKNFEVEAPEKNTSPPLSGITDSPAALAASVDGVGGDYFLRDGFALNTTVGPGPKKTIDVFVDRLSGGNPFKPFGTWQRTF